MLEGMLAETELRAYRGHKIVEVKPMWANKGALATELLSGYASDGFILGIGDDLTDEDLFARLPENAWSIHVGGGVSKARYSLTDTPPRAPIALPTHSSQSRNPARGLNQREFGRSRKVVRQLILRAILTISDPHTIYL